MPMLGEHARSAVEAIGANVRAGRNRLGLTQEQLAEAADIDLRFLQRIERGTTNLSIAVLASLAASLKVKLPTLLRPAKIKPAKRGRPRQSARKSKRTD